MCANRPEMVVGWYHSHPGFGCWLSGVDINTQQVLHVCPMYVATQPVSMTVPMHQHCLAAKQTYRMSSQSFEQLNPRAVAVVVDPIQSVKGKVVIDAFRSGSRPLNHLCLLKHMQHHHVLCTAFRSCFE